MSKHTAGPWRQGPYVSMEIVQDKNKEKTGHIGVKIAHVCHFAGTRRETAEANAKLISAAPDMLAALKEMAEYMKSNKNVQNMQGPEYGIWHRAKAIIDMAEGEV